MFPCNCGREFKSPISLIQHQRDKAKLASTNDCTPLSQSQPGEPRSQASGVDRLSQHEPSQRKKGKQSEWITKGAGMKLQTIDASSLTPSDTPVSSSEGYEIICTYNWAKKKEPEIYVPGAPPVWKGISLPLQLSQDSGLHFIDQNTARVPKYPFEVLFKAAEVVNPSFRFDHINVLVNRNSLRKLLDFCHGRRQFDFRLDLHAVQKTLIIQRCEKMARQMIHGSEGRGFGRNFERRCTELPGGLKKSSGHHRVLRYKLGSLNCAVAFEVDASYSDSCEPGFLAEGQPAMLPRDRASASIHPPNAEGGRKDVSAKVILRGSMTQQSTMAEIKSSARRQTSTSKFMPQLWFGRTPHLILGCHTDGTFDSIQITDCGDRFVDWETAESNQTALRKLVSLLSGLRDIVLATKEMSCIAVYKRAPDSVDLQVFASNQGKKPLPEDVIRKFWAEDHE